MIRKISFSSFLGFYLFFLFSISCAHQPSKDRRPAEEDGNVLYKETTYAFDKNVFDVHENSATTKILKTPFGSNFIGVYWPRPKNFRYNYNFLIRSSVDGKHWTRWKDIFLADEGADEVIGKEKDYSALVYTRAAKYFQFHIARIYFSKIQFEKFVFIFIDSRSQAFRSLAQEGESEDKDAVNDRNIWGADEKNSWVARDEKGDLKKDKDGNFLKEDPTPQPFIKHLIIHHSALDNNLPHEKCHETICAYQAAHLKKKWSDIGYNYLICQHGYLYVGRRRLPDARRDGASVVDVIGAQAELHNRGTLGVDAIGLYMNTKLLNSKEKEELKQSMTDSKQLKDDEDFENYSVVPSKELQERMIKFLVWKSRQYDLDPLGSSPYTAHGEKTAKSLPTILGHSDVKQTLCPGNNLYSLIDKIFRPTVSKLLEEEKRSK